MGTRRARVTRGMLASGAAIFVAALFHVAGGGSAPGLVPVVLSLAFATLASIALTSRRLSLWRLTVAVAISQFLFHALFSLGSPSAVRFSAPAHGMPGMAGGPLTVVAHSGSMTGHSELSPSMWLAHAGAVLITVVALRFGERAFWGLFETARVRVARFAERLHAAPVALRPVIAPVAAAEAGLLHDLGLPLARLRHRGPPAALGAL
ncbi:hypothetical protein [Leifsonia sp. AG29]|uniref:hypothetical protein n=1 Tax=Leifsonia sp. AG29 TaxID=2598860 RepID=UPI00131D982A|nr:hypothetical protein [Leifsonia sp. AG29]